MAQDFAEVTRTVEFKMAVEMDLAADRGLFRPLAMQGSDTGKAIEVTDRFSRLQMEEITVRNGRTNNVDPDVIRRWINKPKRAGVAPLIDADDVLATKVGLKSPLVMGVADAARAYADDQWLRGFYGVAATGETGAVSVAFKTANVIAADYDVPGTPSGLTYEKILKVNELRRQRFVKSNPADPFCVSITALEISALLRIDKFINGFYRESKPLESGEPTDFLGIHWIPAEITSAANYKNGAALALNGSGHRRLPCWVPSGMYVNSWLEFEAHDDVRADMNHSEQFAGYSCIAATRVNEDKCFIIEVL